MCGIAGFVGAGVLADLKRMTDAIAHRGPDAEGHWVSAERGVYLGHRRLSILDHAGGAQPMWTTDGKLGIVFNGEIYNHADLRRQLVAMGHVFVTDHSDTETLLHGYRQWGADLPNHLNGMWAFAIYDICQWKIFGSRDRFGKKPFFYYHASDLFAFASELSALARGPKWERSIDRLALKKFFAYGYIPAPLTPFEQVAALPGGCNLTFDIVKSQLEIRRYWEFTLEPIATIPSDAEAVWGEELRSLLSEAVKRRLLADVPLGVFLSGGVDSSILTYLASQLTPPGTLKTFSIGFEEASFDETRFSSQVAQLFQTDHTVDRLSLQSAIGLLPEITAKLDIPLGDNSLLPTYLLCKATRKHVTVALGGDGADELFCGYDPFRALRLAESYARFVPKPVHAAIRHLAGLLPTSNRNMSLDFRIKRTLRGLSYDKPYWAPIWMASLDPQELESLFGEPIDLEELYSEAIEAWDSCYQTKLIDKTLEFFTKLYLQDDILVKIDRASMFNSLEARSPFLDIDVVNFIRQLPSEFKYRNGQTKYLLKKAFEPYIPQEILYRSKKGFGTPVGKWLQEGHLQEAPPLSDLGLSPEFYEQAKSEHRRQKRDQRAYLWSHWILSQWRETFSKSL